MTDPTADQPAEHHRAAVHDAVEGVVRDSYGRILAFLASTGGDIAAAEDALSEALLAALRTWPRRGVPARPDSWLVTAARRNLIDAGRRRATASRALPELARSVSAVAEEPAGDPLAGEIPDGRMRLMFVCAHPAVAENVRSPLMLQTVLGMDAARIAAVFLVPPATMGQRLVRAKAKIKAAGVPFRVPEAPLLPERLGAVLDAVYAAYTSGSDEVAGEVAGGSGSAAEAIRLGRVAVSLLPDQPEARGLLALMLHCEARRPARRADDGTFVPLDEQDTARWSKELMAEAEAHLGRAAALRVPGPYQLMAAIQSVHNRRVVTGRTDRRAIVLLYEGLVRLAPSVGALVARAAAGLAADGPDRALELLDEVPTDRAAAYQPYWVVRAAAMDALGRTDEATSARSTALRLTRDPAVRAHLTGAAARPGAGTAAHAGADAAAHAGVSRCGAGSG